MNSWRVFPALPSGHSTQSQQRRLILSVIALLCCDSSTSLLTQASLTDPRQHTLHSLVLQYPVTVTSIQHPEAFHDRFKCPIKEMWVFGPSSSS